MEDLLLVLQRYNSLLRFHELKVDKSFLYLDEIIRRSNQVLTATVASQLAQLYSLLTQVLGFSQTCKGSSYEDHK